MTLCLSLLVEQLLECCFTICERFLVVQLNNNTATKEVYLLGEHFDNSSAVTIAVQLVRIQLTKRMLT